MDATTIGIALGLVATAAYSIVRAVRQKTFDLGSTLLVFLAGFSVPAGASLIAAAVSCNPATLPTSWREYVVVAGIAVIGLALQYLVQSFRAAWAKRATVEEPPSGPKGAP